MAWSSNGRMMAAASSSPSSGCASTLFEYDCDAVRVHAKRTHPKTGVAEQRKFSVDPNLTSYGILKSILARAFDLGDDSTASAEFVVYFASPDGDWMPMLSDWDLDVAILSSAEPILNLMVTETKIKRLLANLSKSPEIELEMASPSIVVGPATTAKSTDNAFASVPSSSSYSSATKSNPAIFSLFRQQVEKSLPSITTRIHKALSLAEETIIPKSHHVLSLLDSATAGSHLDGNEFRPLSEKEFRSFLNKVGEVAKPRELRLAVYQAGADSSLRKVLWKHLLGVYPGGITGKERIEFIKRQSTEYGNMKQIWLELVLQGRMTDDLKYVTNMVKKDVLRTDRHLSFFSGEGNNNVNLLYNILTTYALNHPSVGYCQGMSDLLSPLLVVMGDESHAYICFCALMARMEFNFKPDGKLMTQKFEHLSQGLLFYDPEFYAYLKMRHSDDLLFCYRWLLLEMKREFSFEDSCLAMEVLWSSLPPLSPNGDCGVRLYEQRFKARQPSNMELSVGHQIP
jgi:hypothetical protein